MAGCARRCADGGAGREFVGVSEIERVRNESYRGIRYGA